MPTIRFNVVTRASDLAALNQVEAPANKLRLAAVAALIIGVVAAVLTGVDPAHLFTIASAKAGAGVGEAVAGVAIAGVAMKKRAHILNENQRALTRLKEYVALGEKIEKMPHGERRKALTLTYLQNKHWDYSKYTPPQLPVQGNLLAGALIHNIPKYDDLESFLEPIAIDEETALINGNRPMVDVDLFGGVCGSSCLYVAREIGKGRTMSEVIVDFQGGAPREAVLHHLLVPRKNDFDRELFDLLWLSYDSDHYWDYGAALDDFLTSVNSADDKRALKRIFVELDHYKYHQRGTFVSSLRQEIPQSFAFTIQWFSACVEKNDRRGATPTALVFRRYNKDYGDNLPWTIPPGQGLYWLKLPTSSGIPHATLLHREQNSCTLFDPNFGAMIGIRNETLLQEVTSFYHPGQAEGDAVIKAL